VRNAAAGRGAGVCVAKSRHKRAKMHSPDTQTTMPLRHEIDRTPLVRLDVATVLDSKSAEAVHSHVLGCPLETQKIAERRHYHLHRVAQMLGASLGLDTVTAVHAAIGLALTPEGTTRNAYLDRVLQAAGGGDRDGTARLLDSLATRTSADEWRAISTEIAEELSCVG
jgi:hypothetical protein